MKKTAKIYHLFSGPGTVVEPPDAAAAAPHHRSQSDHFRQADMRSHDRTTVINIGTEFNSGEMSAAGQVVEVHGRFEGTLHCGELLIAGTGVVLGRIKADGEVKIHGAFLSGAISANKVLIYETATVGAPDADSDITIKAEFVGTQVGAKLYRSVLATDLPDAEATPLREAAN